MRTTSTLGIESRSLGSSSDGSSGAASSTFVVVTALLVTMAFMFPIKRSWTMSLDENYTRIFVDYGEKDAAGEAWGRPVGLAALGLFGLLAIWWPGGRQMRVHGALAILWIAFVAWCAASCFWADDRMFSLMRFIGNLCGIVAAYAIAKRATPQQFAWIVLICTASWLGLGFLAELSLGTFRPWDEEHRFAGIFHPNGMGAVCALLVLSAIYLARSEQRRQKLLWVTAAVGFVFLYLTRSRTALIAMMLVVTTASLFVAPRRRVLLSVMVGACVVAIVGLFIGSALNDAASNAAALGRVESDVSSLTGRVPLWQDLLPYVAKRPWLGYGYSFWSEELELSEPVQSAHSLYLDSVLAFGCIGTALYLSGILLALKRSMRLVSHWPQAGCGLMGMLLMYLLINGLAETTIGFTDFLGFFVMCGICFLAFRDDLYPSVTSDAKSPPQVAVHALVRQWRRDYRPRVIDA